MARRVARIHYSLPGMALSRCNAGMYTPMKSEERWVIRVRTAGHLTRSERQTRMDVAKRRGECR